MIVKTLWVPIIGSGQHGDAVRVDLPSDVDWKAVIPSSHHPTLPTRGHPLTRYARVTVADDARVPGAVDESLVPVAERLLVELDDLALAGRPMPDGEADEVRRVVRGASKADARIVLQEMRYRGLKPDDAEALNGELGLGMKGLTDALPVDTPPSVRGWPDCQYAGEIGETAQDQLARECDYHGHPMLRRECRACGGDPEGKQSSQSTLET